MITELSVVYTLNSYKKLVKEKSITFLKQNLKIYNKMLFSVYMYATVTLRKGKHAINNYALLFKLFAVRFICSKV